MLLTGLQHRKIAKVLDRKAMRLAPHLPRVQEIKRVACLHMGLARAQERNPALADRRTGRDSGRSRCLR
jgi:hypothetical protein